MNWDILSGQWQQFKGKVREKWGKLTDDDLDIVAGNRDKLAGKLQERYGYARDRALQSADDFISGLSEAPRAPR